MSEKAKRALAWAALGLVAVWLVNEFVKWLRREFAQVKHEAKEEAKNEIREESESRMKQLTTDLATTAKAIREENHQVAREIVDEVRAKLALPAKQRPPGPAGFAGTEAEPV